MFCPLDCWDSCNLQIENVKKTQNEIYYFDKDNSHKNMVALVDSFEGDGYNVHFREVKYGLADDDYMYEVHIM